MWHVYNCFILVCHSYPTCMSSCLIYLYSYVIFMSLARARMSFVSHSHVLVCNGMSLTCSITWSVCHSYVLVYHPYVTRMYSYVTRMSYVCLSYVLVCHTYVSYIYSYMIRMSHVCGFTMTKKTNEIDMVYKTRPGWLAILVVNYCCKVLHLRCFRELDRDTPLLVMDFLNNNLI